MSLLDAFIIGFSIIFGILLALSFSGFVKKIKPFFIVFTFSIAWLSSSFLIYIIFR